MTDYELIRSKRRSLELRVLDDGRVQVRAPQRASLRMVQTFVDSRRQWIADQQQRQASRPRQRWQDGAAFPFRGQSLTMDVSAGRNAVVVSGGYLQIRVPEPDSEPAVRQAVENWLRKQARPLFEDSIARQFPWFASQGFSQPVLRVKKMRTRWGSLSARGYINLNMALLHYPPAALDYVVMHELCHLQHMDHGPGFHALMDARMPDWRQRKQLLDQPLFQP
ncbi:SprT family zinc-dependent metalloprotease [uncultured Alcanivorax sp.]|uniref:M48 family metallopeptidase n=1 Tax=uncultured Alcanivorax sp. TaxID=191215 RepID=UPI0026196EAF|nr:SprT family zinc-dependent metalloprotease [uncultured Alcanivorax sp.]